MSLGSPQDGDQAKDVPIQSDDEFQNMIDPLMEHMDLNKDGYITFAEYTLAKE